MQQTGRLGFRVGDFRLLASLTFAWLSLVLAPSLPQPAMRFCPWAPNALPKHRRIVVSKRRRDVGTTTLWVWDPGLPGFIEP